MQKITKELVFLDTETTGTGVEDKLVQVAYKTTSGEQGNELFKADLPVSVDAMSVCHITNKMLEGKEKFQGSKMHSNLVDLFASKDTILVAHNAKFDINMLKKEGVKVKNYICTLKIAQHLDEEAVIPKYNMQYLRYFLDLDIEGTAHDALGDVLVLEGLFKRLFDKFSEKTDKDIPFAIGDDALDFMVHVSENPVLIKKFTFGKHKGSFIKDVAVRDKGYLEWLKKEKLKEAVKDEDWLFTLNTHLNTLPGDSGNVVE